jgi:hypothetical protein
MTITILRLENYFEARANGLRGFGSTEVEAVGALIVQNKQQFGIDSIQYDSNHSITRAYTILLGKTPGQKL